MSEAELSPIRKKLLRWFERHGRDLPWRRTRDPYAIWLSETMLQQTQVTTALPYYEKFLAALPTVEALAHARLERVLRLWSGLGYYRRAVNLHTAARQILRRHGGRLPQDYDGLRALPGIGDYTAGAILSIAFGKPYAAIDGNARRVLGRVFALGGEGELRTIAVQLVPKARPGDFNQAVMELGATLCAPKNPRCPECPVRRHCLSLERKHLRVVPRRTAKFENVLWPLALVRRGRKILLRRRTAKGLLAQLWELPGGELGRTEKRSDLADRLRRELPLPLGPGRKIGEFRHAITHRRIRAPIYLFECGEDGADRLAAARWRWTDPKKLRGQAVSSMVLKAVNVLFAYEATPS